MKYEFKEDQPEEFYRKLLLLNKVKPFLTTHQKQCIFDKGYCWDILFKDKLSSQLCYYYAVFSLNKKSFPEGEKYIAQDIDYAYLYAIHILDGRFPLGEKVLFENYDIAEKYTNFLKRKKEFELRI